jgi:hypothetical protein
MDALPRGWGFMTEGLGFFNCSSNVQQTGKCAKDVTEKTSFKKFNKGKTLKYLPVVRKLADILIIDFLNLDI